MLRLDLRVRSEWINSSFIGARVILACRDMTKGEQAVSDIMKEVNGANVVARQLDLADTKSICLFAENVYNSGCQCMHTHVSKILSKTHCTEQFLFSS